MKSIIGRVFPKKDEGPQFEAATPMPELSSELSSGDIETYYLRVIVDCLRRMMGPADSIEVGVKRSGVGPGGLAAYAGYVRLLRWDPLLAPVLLQNIPVVDARIRKVVAASVILEHTHFAGLWFTASSATPGAPTALVGLPAELVRQPGGPASAA
jgi:hypothetical protein